MDLNGSVDRAVINAVNNLQVHEDDPQRRYLNLDGVSLNEHEALFVVGFLHGILSQQQGMEDNNNNQQQIGLILSNYDADDDEDDEGSFTDEAVAVFFTFLQHTTTLSALHLSWFPPAQLRPLLSALHTNMSMKELKITHLRGDGSCITELLRHKTDFAALSFVHIDDFDIARILPFLRQGSVHLQKLVIHGCAIGDEGTRLLVDALVNSSNKFKDLKELRLIGNGITCDGLRCLSKLDPDVLPSLESLDLSGNYSLLDDKESTQLFVQKVLLSEGTTLKSLSLYACSVHAVGYNIVIKSLESNKTLRVLKMFPHTENHHRIRDQLVESLPKMTGVHELHLRRECLGLVDDERTMTSLRKNVSLFQVIEIDSFGRELWNDDDVGDARLGAILKRNRQFVQLDGLLRTTTTLATGAGNNPSTITTTTTIPPLPPPPCAGLWAPVLAKVGQGCEGGSPVFTILRNRLATWGIVAAPTTTISTSGDHGTNKKKKKHRQETFPTQTIESNNKKLKQG